MQNSIDIDTWQNYDFTSRSLISIQIINHKRNSRISNLYLGLVIYHSKDLGNDRKIRGFYSLFNLQLLFKSLQNQAATSESAALI